jgi:hypothetical protein
MAPRSRARSVASLTRATTRKPAIKKAPSTPILEKGRGESHSCALRVGGRTGAGAFIRHNEQPTWSVTVLRRRIVHVLAIASVIAAAACGDMSTAPKDGEDQAPYTPQCAGDPPEQGMRCVAGLSGDVWSW